MIFWQNLAVLQKINKKGAVISVPFLLVGCDYVCFLWLIFRTQSPTIIWYQALHQINVDE